MSFYTDVLMKSPVFKSSAVCKDTMMLEPGTRAAILALLDDARRQGHDLRIGETYRSPARQRVLFSEGYTQLKNVGCHGYGVACDLNLFDGGKYVADGKAYAFLADLGKKHGLIWGGDWGEPNKPHSFHDWDHCQRIPVWRQHALFSGQFYPPEDYDPYKDAPLVA